jgi:hypothetical protein
MALGENMALSIVDIQKNDVRTVIIPAVDSDASRSGVSMDLGVGLEGVECLENVNDQMAYPCQPGNESAHHVTIWGI